MAGCTAGSPHLLWPPHPRSVNSFGHRLKAALEQLCPFSCRLSGSTSTAESDVCRLLSHPACVCTVMCQAVTWRLCPLPLTTRVRLPGGQRGLGEARVVLGWMGKQISQGLVVPIARNPKFITCKWPSASVGTILASLGLQLFAYHGCCSGTVWYKWH